MNSKAQSLLRRIERAGVFFRGLCSSLIAVISVATLVGTVAAAAGRLSSVNLAGQSIAFPDLSGRTRLLVAIAVLITGAAVIKAVYHLRRLADNWSRSEIFTGASARQIRQFGYSCFLWSAVRAMWGFLAFNFSPHQPGTLQISADALFIGAAVVVIAWFAEMATALKEENDLTI